MRHLRNLRSQFSISLPPDEEGFIGRECPVAECEGYFKLQPGTGLKGKNLPCHCPYCGHGAGYHFNNLLPSFTKDVGSVERAAFLCDREDMLIDFERRSLMRATRRSSRNSSVVELERRARTLLARVDRAANARDQIDCGATETSQIFQRRIWNGVPVPIGAGLLDGYTILFGTLFLFPFVYYAAGFAWHGIDSIHSLNHVVRFVKHVLTIFWLVGSVASVAAIAVLLGLYIGPARKMNWVLFFGWSVIFLWLVSDPKHAHH